MSDQTDEAETQTFNLESSWNVLRAACTNAGLSSEHARLIRFGENALFHLTDSNVVVRIARTMDYWADAVKEVNVAHWLAGHDFPAAEVYEVPQPIRAIDHPVTFWQFIPGRPGEQRDVATLGALLRRLHETPSPTEFDLPAENILGRVSSRIKVSPIPDTDKEFLLDRLDELQWQVAKLRYPLTPTPTHGDAHVKNLLIHDDVPILIDFERFAYGQPEWDIALAATEYMTAKWWTDREYADFVDAYGYDITEWTDGFDTLRAVHELKMTTWLMQNVDESPEIAAEYQVRMRTLRGEPSPGWRPF